MIEQPPKVYLYQPQISGFKLAGQRGSKYFHPPRESLSREETSYKTCFDLQRKPNQKR